MFRRRSRSPRVVSRRVAPSPSPSRRCSRIAAFRRCDLADAAPPQRRRIDIPSSRRALPSSVTVAGGASPELRRESPPPPRSPAAEPSRASPPRHIAAWDWDRAGERRKKTSSKPLTAGPHASFSLHLPLTSRAHALPPPVNR
ncbi:hypothetical protein DAI22_04g017650 [Oryza sativa Japonica Group]|nr:hypothetical protein DAI22_04g017650 [Oryza sativa Japonica Group]